MLLPGCSNEDLSDHAAAPVFIPGNSEVEIRFAAHSDEVSTSVDKRTTVDEDGNLDEILDALATADELARLAGQQEEA